MKKLFVFLCVAGLIAASASPLFAGGIINKQNQSTDYMRTLNRHAATDYADIAVYNPAGIMKMEDGGYAKLDVMYFSKDYSNTVPNNFGEFNQAFGELSQDEPSIIPGLFAVFKQKKWAGFFAFTIPAGGGQLDYDKGSARTVQLADGIAAGANSQLEAPPPAGFGTNLFNYTQLDSQKIEVKESSVYGFTLGGSYAINDMWSIAAGARYSTGKRELDGTAVISAPNPIPPIFPVSNDPITADIAIEADASGWAGIVGVNFSPNDKLNTALTYISNTKMDYDIEVKRDTDLNGVLLSDLVGFSNGSKTRIDIPALLGFGISYKFLPQLKMDLNYTYYFEKDATIDTFEGEGDSWDLGLSAEYTFSPQWKASLGYLRTDISLDDDQQINEPEEPKLSANTLAAGAVWSITPAYALTFGGAIVMYDDVDGPVQSARSGTYSVNYDKKVWNLAIGFQWKFM